MFTGNTVNLCELADGAGVTVVRDGEFSYIGKIPTNLPRRLVPAIKPEHILAADAADGVAGVITLPGQEGLVPSNMIAATSVDPVSASLRIHESLCGRDGFLWRHFDTEIHPTAKIHPSAVVAARDVRIGPNVEVGPMSVILERTVLDEGVRIGVGVTVGLDAFEIFEQANPRRILKQAGGVWVESGTTILAKTTVVRATFGGFTRIRKHAMIDVLIHIAHDAIIGEGATVVACAEISGRCELGDGAYIGPNACIRNGVRIGRNATVSMGSVVTRDVPDDATVSGNFAVDHQDWLRFVKTLGKSGVSQ
jgi:acyl-[acyl carrier protein]--UDP-N-acetylglucosamine O-acyltransferase